MSSMLHSINPILAKPPGDVVALSLSSS